MTFKRTVLVVAALNLAFFFVEFTAAYWANSVSLFADSIDFLEDTCLNMLVFLALFWKMQNQGKLGLGLAVLLIMPGLATLWALYGKFAQPLAPAPLVMTVIGIAALMVNLACAYLLAKHRLSGGSLITAAFLSARNDALANLGILVAAAMTFITPSIWPDVVVGIVIAILNLDAAREVYEKAREELKSPAP